jgi:hypothetical protein
MVVDSNFLQNDELRRFLARSSSNFAVLTDYASMEAYKGNALVSIYKSMAIVCEFPKQVIVLKGTQTVCGLSGRRAGLQRRLIDERQTQQFPIYCRRLSAAEHGDLRLQTQLLKLGREADDQMNRVLADAQTMADRLEGVAKTFTKDELRALRAGGSIPAGMRENIVRNIMWIAGFFFRDHPRTNRLPPWNEAPNTFIFRLSICMYLWALDWISVGGAKGTKPETIRNDIIDLNFAAYASFFDGLFTSDKKLSYLYRDANKLYQIAFAPE